ncbi:hypothetical protein Slin14017_G120140 [Septoria linicola]|nr:hypothetical protein Slin14017_G120140 [Septoria linicola]
MKWLLGTDPKQWDLTLRRELLGHLCWHLEAEDRSQAVGSCLRIWSATEDLRAGAAMAPKAKGIEYLHAKYTYFDWPAQVLFAMVHAKLYWSVNADAAIEFYLEYKDLKGMWDGYACNAILAALQRDWAPPCELFDRFVTHVTRHHDSASGHQNSFKSRAVRAQLMLFHPEKPDPALYLDWIRSPGAVERMKQWKKDAKKRSSASYSLRAAYLLRLQGAREDARSLENVLADLDADVWNARFSIYKSMRKDPKLARVQARSSFSRQDWARGTPGLR